MTVNTMTSRAKGMLMALVLLLVLRKPIEQADNPEEVAP